MAEHNLKLVAFEEAPPNYSTRGDIQVTRINLIICDCGPLCQNIAHFTVDCSTSWTKGRNLLSVFEYAPFDSIETLLLSVLITGIVLSDLQDIKDIKKKKSCQTYPESCLLEYEY